MSSFKRILVAVDGSQVALKAVDFAARLARNEGVELIVLHVVPRPPFEFSGDAAAYYEEARRTAKKWLPNIERAVKIHNVRMNLEIIVDASSVIEAILAYVETNNVDLIVTGTRGKTPSQRMLMGSVANGLVEYANCSVLVVR
ncbi:MAG TPA: universal stress protein [Nitrososphaerales archaeon]